MALRQGRFRFADVVGAVVLVVCSVPVAFGDDDEPRGLGRFFRFGNRNQAAREAEARAKSRPVEDDDAPASVRNSPVADPSRLLRSQPGMAATPGSSSLAPYNSLGAHTAPGNAPSAIPGRDRLVNGSPGLPADVGAPAPGPAGTATRLVPQPRQSRPVTEAPPLLTRVQLGRSDDGQTFGMFLQIYSDGTVVDTEGAHQVGREVLQPLVDALRTADAGRLRGHCGSPPVDYIEQVMVVVYDQSRGRLQANHFSYSGNTQGCNPAIRKLQEAIDAVQMKISGNGAPARSTQVGATGGLPETGPHSQPLVPPNADAAPAPPVLSVPDVPSVAPPRLDLTPVGEV